MPQKKGEKIMTRGKMPLFMAMVVVLMGISVMVGWVFDIQVLKSILPFWVTMKFTTALCFVLSGFILIFTSTPDFVDSQVRQISLSMASFIILLLMATLLASVIFGIRTGIEDLFVKETEGAIKTTTPGRPSAGTMISFVLIATAGLLSVLKLDRLLPAIGKGVLFFGALAIVGYLIQKPLFYYTLEGWSTAMAFHTALLFCLLGVGLGIRGK